MLSIINYHDYGVLTVGRLQYGASLIPPLRTVSATLRASPLRPHAVSGERCVPALSNHTDCSPKDATVSISGRVHTSSPRAAREALYNTAPEGHS